MQKTNANSYTTPGQATRSKLIWIKISLARLVNSDRMMLFARWFEAPYSVKDD